MRHKQSLKDVLCKMRFLKFLQDSQENTDGVFFSKVACLGRSKEQLLQNTPWGVFWECF